ncbi:MAG: hypothetical protein HRT42_13590 [Campylobacteraceae bacterium]|nr:hypothetical protein [Campylobacteraceae bacterium]
MLQLSVDEKIAILQWTSPSKDKFYRDIKKVAQNKYINSSHVTNDDGVRWFKSIENLFIHKEDNTLRFDTIYRADIIENNTTKLLTEDQLFNKFSNDIKVGEIFKMEDILCSFSIYKEISLRIAQYNDKYNQETKTTPIVMYILKKRVSKYLYIAPHAAKAVKNEEEVLTLGIKTFKILNKIKRNNNYIEVYLEEVTK